LRSINWLMNKPIDIYADGETKAQLNERFAYIFDGVGVKNFYKPSVTAHEITGPFTVGNIAVTPFTQNHGNTNSLGFRFGDFAYTTDAHILDDAAWEILRGVKTWIVDCVRPEPHPTHSHIEQTLQWIDRIKPDRAFLTHMNHMMDYDTLIATLPPGVFPAYDGLVLEC
jgi:phosphoribosyl 1,2-cyclic phosphate phosphodiesterase